MSPTIVGMLYRLFSFLGARNSVQNFARPTRINQDGMMSTAGSADTSSARKSPVCPSTTTSPSRRALTIWRAVHCVARKHSQSASRSRAPPQMEGQTSSRSANKPTMMAMGREISIFCFVQLEFWSNPNQNIFKHPVFLYTSDKRVFPKQLTRI